MAIPSPRPGLVISYAYLWHREAMAGQEEGRKDRPCVIIVAIEQPAGGEVTVKVVPVTHRPPDDLAAALELPRSVKRHLGLDDDRSWIILSELNEFDWPGFDLRPTAGGSFAYGDLPPRLFADLVARLRAHWRSGRGRTTSRD